jgi:hypothetical protein
MAAPARLDRGKMIQVNFIVGETFLTNVLPVP